MLGALPKRLSASSSSKSILILPSFYTLQWVLGQYPLTESAGTIAKGTAQSFALFCNFEISGRTILKLN